MVNLHQYYMLMTHIYHKHFIEKQVSFLTKHAEVGIVFTEAKLIDLDGQLLGQVDYPVKI